jgi:hypothetical protein
MKLSFIRAVIFASTVLTSLLDFSAWAQMSPRAYDLTAQAPVATEVLPSGVIAVLESKGGLLFMRPGSNKFVRAKSTMGVYSPIDITGRVQNNKETVLVSMYWASAAQMSQSVSGVIIEYGLDGNELQQWHFFGHVFRGMAIDTSSQILYLTDSNSPSVYALNLESPAGKPMPELFAHIAGASSLGPISIDLDSRRLFVGDFEQGSVYAVSLSNRLSKPFVSSLGEPSALAFDKTSRRLFIADAAKKCVWEISVDAKVPQAIKFSTDPELREPRGIAVATGPTIWVADFRSGKILALAPTGKATSSYRNP